MLLHTITMFTPEQIVASGLEFSEEQISFNEFIGTEIFPGGQLPAIEIVEFHSSKMGFNLARRQSLRLHYARTLDLWAEALEAHHTEAVEIQSEEVYQTYMRYLTGCADAFRAGYIDLNQFTLRK
jgi:cyclopropane-fatty-acyl-phospholipid synthase